MSQPSHPAFLLELIRRARHLQSSVPNHHPDRGYIMIVTVMLSVMIFSLLSAYLVVSNIHKTSTGAYIDGHNTFTAAESGLNVRANEVLKKFEGFSRPTGSAPKYKTAETDINFFSLSSKPSHSQIASAMLRCIKKDAEVGTGDLACRGDKNATTGPDAAFNFASRWKDVSSGGYGGSTQATEELKTSGYTVYSFVLDRTDYTSGQPPLVAIPPGDSYGGLNAQSYSYTVYASAVDNQVATGTTNANTVLQMEFKSRVIPLFQFAAFYENDLEINSSSDMTVGGRIHTNSNLYIQPHTVNSTGSVTTTLLNPVTALGRIFNRVDAPDFAALGTGATNTYIGTARVLLTGTDCSVATNCQAFPARSASKAIPLGSSSSVENVSTTSDDLTRFNGRVMDGVMGVRRLTVPDSGFLRKRNYKSNRIGEYWGKADLRLEMVPDRDVTTFTSNGNGWTRNEAIIPFNLTAIKATGSGSCMTTKPTAGDPPWNYIDPERVDASTLKCDRFTKGQLQSLRQPVLVLTNINQADATLRTLEDGILGKPTAPSLPAAVPGLATALVQQRTLRALQVAIASTSRPIPLDRFNSTLGSYTAGTPEAEFGTEFRRLIQNSSINLAANALDGWTPNQIAALQGAWFLPAPIQRSTSNVDTTNVTTRTNTNVRRSGFYDGREQRWMTMLQTNLQSLAVWNRDGLYVNATDENLTAAYTTNNTNKDGAFSSGNGANPTAGMAYERLAANPTQVGLRRIGLGSTDTTEGGLLFHATVNDDLNGNGTIDSTTEVSSVTTEKVFQKNHKGDLVEVDYKRTYGRTYGGGNTVGTSPFAFAFNGGNYLPGALTLATDQGIYIQGDFNNNGNTTPFDTNRLPAAIIGDAITVLSNQCVANSSAQNTTNNHLGVLQGQLNCGLPDDTTGAIEVMTGNPYYAVTQDTTVNAAFLSFITESWGNLGVNRGYDAVNAMGTDTAKNNAARYSGGLNNYMRMLEGWGGSTGQFFNYNGSLISLGNPLECNGRYLGRGIYYQIPRRNFRYDTNFNSVDSLPPLTPRVVYLQQQLFRRTF
jgi:hypothetical protein